MIISDGNIDIKDTKEALFVKGKLGNLELTDYSNYPNSVTDPQTKLESIDTYQILGKKSKN